MTADQAFGADGPGKTATEDPQSHSSAPRTTNPFRSLPKPEHQVAFVPDLPSVIPPPHESAPYKSLNRIVEDLRYTPAYQKQRSARSLLRCRPIEYAVEVAKIAARKPKATTVTINNDVAFAPTVEIASIDSHGNVTDTESEGVFTRTVIRGLIDTDGGPFHFRIAIIDAPANPFVTVDKHVYYAAHGEELSPFEARALDNHCTSVLDDAIFRSTAATRHVLRVTIMGAEFLAEDLWPLLNGEIIAKRYEAGTKRHPDLNLAPNSAPTSVHCINTLLKVLKGPILLAPGDPIKTISLTKTSLDTQIDVDLLTTRLGFVALGEDVVPPNLATNLPLREAYIRKSIELIYVGANIEHRPNAIHQQYTFSDNLSVLYRVINESDRHDSIIHGSSSLSSLLPFFVSLSAAPFFSDEHLIQCYEQTIKSDKKNKLHYADALRSIVNYKRSQNGGNSKLQSYFKQLSQSNQLVGYEDYRNALKVIGIDQASDSLTDEGIIAVYKAQYEADPRNYSYYNRHLRLIAGARDSLGLQKYIKNEVLPVSLAMDDLGIEEITEDEVVITAFEFKLDDLLQSNNFNPTASEVLLLNRSLLSVAVNRKSYQLMSYYERKIDLRKPALSVAEALQMLALYGAGFVKDVDIISAFQDKIAAATDVEAIQQLRAALRVLADNRELAVLLSFLHSGKIDLLLLPAENWPAGLDNIGNTCYLNSLLQYYFCLQPLRQMVLDFPRNASSVEIHQERKIGGRKVERLEVIRSHQFVYHLQKLFLAMIHTNQRCVAPSKELAYLAFLPLSQPVGFGERRETKTGEKIEEETKEHEANDMNMEGDGGKNLDASDGITTGVMDESGAGQNSPRDPQSLPPKRTSISQSLLTLLGDSLEPIVVPSRSPTPQLPTSENSASDILMDESNGPKTILPILDEIDSTIEVGRQQDVTECIENVTFQLETALDPESVDDDGEQMDLIKQLFYGKVLQKLTPLTKDVRPRVTTERFFSLIINVSDHPKDIYDSLDGYFSEDAFNLDEGEVKKSLTVSQLPEVLQFHVQRVLFDRERLMAYKSVEHIPFTEQIYLDRYMETDDEDILSKREQVFQWRSEIRAIHEERTKLNTPDSNSNLTILEALVTTKKYLEARVVPSDSVAVNPATILSLQVHIDQLQSKLANLDARLEHLNTQVANQFTAYTQVGYSIFAIFIHRGEASYGHYWVYIKDPQRDIFRKYNDEIVTEVPASEVFNFAKENTATPYYIVYVKNSLEKEYVQPLRREIE